MLKNFFETLLNWIKSLFDTEEPDSGNAESIETGSTEPIETGTTVDPVSAGTAEEPVTAFTPITISFPQYASKMVVLLDNGHASSTPGKRSPVTENGEQFFEYEFNRDIVRRLSARLAALGIKYEILVPEVDEDVSLTKRANRANEFCQKYGTKNCLFISVHANAAGNGSDWVKAKGWSCYTSKGETASDPYAEIFMQEAEGVLEPMGFTTRKFSAKKYSWEENFTVLVKTNCPAILTENLFYDNRKEMQFLQSDEGREAITQIHVNAIMKIISSNQ